jgi:hypothetical protein
VDACREKEIAVDERARRICWVSSVVVSLSWSDGLF